MKINGFIRFKAPPIYWLIITKVIDKEIFILVLTSIGNSSLFSYGKDANFYCQFVYRSLGLTTKRSYC